MTYNVFSGTLNPTHFISLYLSKLNCMQLIKAYNDTSYFATVSVNVQHSICCTKLFKKIYNLHLQMATKRLCFCLGLLVCLSYLFVGKIIKKVVDKFS